MVRLGAVAQRFKKWRTSRWRDLKKVAFAQHCQRSLLNVPPVAANLSKTVKCRNFSKTKCGQVWWMPGESQLLAWCIWMFCLVSEKPKKKMTSLDKFDFSKLLGFDGCNIYSFFTHQSPLTNIKWLLICIYVLIEKNLFNKQVKQL